MKPSSRARYLRGIDRITDRLSECIAGEEALPGIAALARLAHLSEFHFMRIYRALTSESLGATVQRLRLERAAHLLVGTAIPIREIAARSGYETPQAFARAFRKLYGTAPGTLRKMPQGSLDKALSRAQRSRQHGPPPLVAIEIVELQPFRVAALRNHGDYADLDRAYTRLFQWMAAKGGFESVTAIWGIPHDDRRDTPSEACVFDCCLATSAELPEDADVRIMTLGGGRYAVSRHTGSYPRLDEAHDAIFVQMFAAGLVPRESPILHQFLNDPESTPEAALETCIYVPVEQETTPCGK